MHVWMQQLREPSVLRAWGMLGNFGRTRGFPAIALARSITMRRYPWTAQFNQFQWDVARTCKMLPKAPMIQEPACLGPCMR
eukprot:1158111-Pelagomonas_calceolata.AAC.3